MNTQPPIPPEDDANPYQPPEHGWSDQPREAEMGTDSEEEYPKPPLEDVYWQGSKTAAAIETIRRLILQPSAFFRGIKEDDSVDGAASLTTLLHVIGGLLAVLAQYAYMELEIPGLFPPSEFGEYVWESPALAYTNNLLFALLLTTVLLVFRVFVGLAFYSAVYYIIGKLLNSFDHDFNTMFRLLSYCALALTPPLLASPLLLIPYFGVLFVWLLTLVSFIWLIVLFVKGLKGISRGRVGTGRALLTVLMPLLFCLSIVILFGFLQGFTQ